MILVLLCIGLALDPGHGPHASAKGGQGDAALYRAIDGDVLRGQDYYHAAAAEQRRQGYPLRPFVTMRLPTLAWLFRLTGGMQALTLLLRLLSLITIIATMIRLRAMLPSRPLWIIGCALTAMAATVLVQAPLGLWHETWAGLLIALALACRQDRHWGLSVGLGLTAALFREIALPFLIAMTGLALSERRRAEGFAWGGAILVLFAVLALHYRAASDVLLPGDPASPGWSSFGGWHFDLIVLRDTSVFALLPRPLGSALVPLALFGWATVRSAYATRFACALMLWLGAFLVIGRQDNFYWGLMMAPLFPVGLALMVPTLCSLVRAAQ